MGRIICSCLRNTVEERGIGNGKKGIKKESKGIAGAGGGILEVYMDGRLKETNTPDIPGSGSNHIV